MLKNSKRYQETLEKGIDWMKAQMNADGSVNPLDKGAIAYYKIPWAFVLAGKFLEAKKMIDWIVRETIAPDGDLKSEKRQKFHLDYYTYPNDWICLASHLLSLFDISYSTWNYISSHQDPITGGYCSRAPYDKGKDNLEDLISTAWTSNVGLHLGKIKEAKKAANFLKMMLEIQPDFEHNLYYYWYPQRGLVTERPAEEPEDKFFRINTEEPDNFYYILGATISFLAKLYLVTKDKEHLSLARTYFDFVSRGRGMENLLQTESAGKMCYASTHLYYATGEERYLETAERCMDHLIETWHADGYYIREGKPTASSTAEFCVWIVNLLAVGNSERILC